MFGGTPLGPVTNPENPEREATACPRQRISRRDCSNPDQLRVSTPGGSDVAPAPHGQE
jgi:hypothetical protein